MPAALTAAPEESSGANGVAQAGQSTGSPEVGGSNPFRLVAPECSSARKGLAFYRLRHSYWSELRGVHVKVRISQPHGCAHTLWTAHLVKKRAFQARLTYERWIQRIVNEAEPAIRYVFGVYAGQALAVAECESGLSRHAHNGQYLGIFQMGDYARHRFGHGETFLSQARAAHRYFVLSGKDWSPWACKP